MDAEKAKARVDGEVDDVTDKSVLNSLIQIGFEGGKLVRHNKKAVTVNPDDF